MLHLDEGLYGLIECKLGSRDIDEGAKLFLEIKRLIRQKNEMKKQRPLREDDLLIVFTGDEFDYISKDVVKAVLL